MFNSRQSFKEMYTLGSIALSTIQLLLTSGILSGIIPIDSPIGMMSAGASILIWNIVLLYGWHMYRREETDLFSIVVLTTIWIGSLVIAHWGGPAMAEVLALALWIFATKLSCKNFLTT